MSHFARVGQTLSICCPVSSYPPPRNVTWKKNGTQLQQGSETILTIILDKDDKFGTYTCTASDDNPSTEPIEIVITVMKEICKYRLVNILLCIYHHITQANWIIMVHIYVKEIKDNSLTIHWTEIKTFDIPASFKCVYQIKFSVHKINNAITLLHTDCVGSKVRVFSYQFLTTEDVTLYFRRCMYLS